MKKKKKVTPKRMSILFVSVFILFSFLVLRLGYVQIVHGEDYKREMDRREHVTIENPVPRGNILDRNSNKIVENKPRHSITYINEGASQKEMFEISAKLAKLITQSTDKVSERDKKEYWLLKNPEKATQYISNNEWQLYKEKKLNDKELYKRKLDRITNSNLLELTDQDIEILAIFKRIHNGSKYAPQVIKNVDVSKEEFAKVTENLDNLPGVNASTDWVRHYHFNETFKTILGKTTTADEGLPAEKLDEYLAKGYTMNDRVGRSYLELQYEDILRGKKEKVINITNKSGHLLEEKVVFKGQRGKDLILSIDLNLQIEIEKIIEDELRTAKSSPGTELLDRGYVVLMDPYTGEILAMAGKRIYNDQNSRDIQFEDDALGNITTSYNVGSTVKGATIITGFQTGAIYPGRTFDDKGIKIKGTKVKKSYTYLGSLDDVTALKLSSNVYMFHTAIKIGGGVYQYDQPLSFKPDVFETIRNSFASFGLGIRTGIDLPNEQPGIKGESKLPGFLLDLVIGQYDTYTNMQLAQYISTIANGGYRMQPKLVNELREPETAPNQVGSIYQSFPPKVLNTINLKKEWLNRIHSGFKKVMQEEHGTAYRFFSDTDYSPAGKTGTAQAYYDGPKRDPNNPPPQVMNLSLVGYAPSDSPEVAMAVLVPWAYEGKVDNRANLRIGRRVLDTYFKMRYSTK